MIHTGAMISPTNRSATASDVMNKFAFVFSDLFFAMNHKTSEFPTIACKLRIPHQVDMMIFVAMLN